LVIVKAMAMKVLDIDEIEGRRITVPGMTRVLKDILVTKNMTTHLGVIPPGQSSSRHVHPESEEVVYVVKGEGWVETDGERKDLMQNYLVFLKPGEYHQYKSTGKNDLVLFVVYSPPAEVPKK